MDCRGGGGIDREVVRPKGFNYNGGTKGRGGERPRDCGKSLLHSLERMGHTHRPTPTGIAPSGQHIRAPFRLQLTHSLQTSSAAETRSFGRMVVKCTV